VRQFTVGQLARECFRTSEHKTRLALWPPTADDHPISTTVVDPGELVDELVLLRLMAQRGKNNRLSKAVRAFLARENARSAG
jgi:hypothetical protein